MVNFGVFMFCTANTMQPAELAMAAEDLGFESLYFPEHTHIPMRRWNGEPPDRYGTVTLNREGIRPYGRPSDSDTFTFAEEYISLYDPFIAIANAAAVTDTLNFGTAISLINQHDVITFARELASLDRISQGRLTIGFGGGWFPDEMADHGIPFEHRWQIARERVEAMRELWTKKEPEYHGEFVDFDKCWMDMKPMRRGGPPFLLGTNSKPAHRRVVEYCDGWLAPPGRPRCSARASSVSAASPTRRAARWTPSTSTFSAPSPTRGTPSRSSRWASTGSSCGSTSARPPTSSPAQALREDQGGVRRRLAPIDPGSRPCPSTSTSTTTSPSSRSITRP